MPLDQFADLFRFERVDVVRAFHVTHHCAPERGGVPERVEEWKDADDRVGRFELSRFFECSGVGLDVLVREHHALGDAS